MSQSRSRARLIRSGITAGVVGAALLVAPQAAYAVANVGPMIVTPGSPATLFDSAVTFTANSAVQISTTACNAGSKFGTVAANGPWNAPVTNQKTNSVTFTVPASTTPTTGGPPTGTNGAVKPYFVCVYEGSTVPNGASVGSSVQTSAPINVGAQPLLSAVNGLSGGGNQLTTTVPSNMPLFTPTMGAIFTNAPSCPAVLGTTTSSNLVVTNIVKQSTTSVSFIVPPGVVVNGGGPTMYNVCFYDSQLPAGALLTFTQYNVNLVALNVASGSYLVSNGVTGTSTQPFLSGVTAPGVLVVQGGGCPNAYNNTSNFSPTPIAVTGVGSVRRLTNYRLAVTIPPLTQNPPSSNQPMMPYQICFYSNNTTGTLLGSGAYSATIIAAATAVFPRRVQPRATAPSPSSARTSRPTRVASPRRSAVWRSPTSSQSATRRSRPGHRRTPSRTT
jgi:hypothetical protein